MKATIKLAMLAALCVPISFASAKEESLSGFCIDNAEAGCLPRHIPFEGLAIDFCEATCTLINPEDVPGLDATLYDLACESDQPAEETARVMILRQTDWAGQKRISLVDGRETRPVVPCP